METGDYWKRRLTRRRLLWGAGVGAAGLAGAALIGCGGGGGGNGTPGASSTGGETAARRGGRLVVGVGYQPSSLDAQLAANGGDSYFIDAIYNGILAYDENGAVEQARALSESYEVVDKTNIVFKLRRGVTFHDGTEFDSQAVKFNVERGKDKDLAAVVFAALQPVSRVETPDQFTVRYILSEPYAGMLNDLGGRAGFMLSPTAVQKDSKGFGSSPVGTGAYKMTQYIPGSKVVLEKNPTFWRKGTDGQPLPYLDRVEVQTVLDPTAVLAALNSGDLHIGAIAARDVSAVKSNPGLQVTDKAGGTVDSSMLVFNWALPPADNVNVRRAVAWAIDPAAANKAVYNDLSVVAKGFLYAPGSPMWQEISTRPKYDPAKAKEFLNQAGYPNGLEFPIMTHTAPATSQQTEIYQEQLRRIGIDAKITVEAVSQATNDFFRSGKGAMYSTTWGTTTAPDPSIRSTLDKDGFYNPAKKQDPDLQALIEKARTSYDEAERKNLYNQIAVMALDRCMFVPMLYGVTHTGVSKKVGGLNRLWTAGATWRYDELFIA